MSTFKDFKELAWNVTEEEYRQDSALSYSTLARYEKGGFSSINKLDTPIESESITFGSIVDTLITEGIDAFNNKFGILDTTPPSGIADIIKKLALENEESELTDIPEETILEAALDWNSRLLPKTKLEKIYVGSDYYRALHLSKGKTIIDRDTYDKALEVVRVLKTSESSKKYFNDDENVKKYYQLKFKTKLHNSMFRIMADLIIVDYKNKWIIPVDLKTTSFNEYDFYKRYLEMRYDIQARLYWRVLENIIKQDEYFKDFKLYSFQFVCINKDSLYPLVWYDPHCQLNGTLTYTTSTNRTILLRDPEIIAKELREYRSLQSKVPNGISITQPNSIVEWITKL